MGSDTWHYPMNVVVVPGTNLQLVITYDPDLFQPAVICAVLDKMASVLDQFVRRAADELLGSFLLEGWPAGRLL